MLSTRYTVETVSDGTQALEAARRERPDLILCDIRVPPLEGLGVLEALRSDEFLRDVPVILLSSAADAEARIEWLRAGADDYFAEPSSQRELQVRVASLLELERMRHSHERQLAAEVQALARLNEYGSRLWRCRDLTEGLGEMLDAVIELLGADKGNVQLLNAGGVLEIAAQRGFEAAFLECFREVSAQDDCACGRAIRAGQPIPRALGARHLRSRSRSRRQCDRLGRFHRGRDRSEARAARP
jgi:CheY-like chemotaxis protein